MPGWLSSIRSNVLVVSPEFSGVGNIMGAAYIEPAVCHGCGTCVSECPARAIQLMHYTDAQILGKLDALFEQTADEVDFVPLESIELKQPATDK